MTHDHHHAPGCGAVADGARTAGDPVCGMSVDPAETRAPRRARRHGRPLLGRLPHEVRGRPGQACVARASRRGAGPAHVDHGRGGPRRAGRRSVSVIGDALRLRAADLG